MIMNILVVENLEGFVRWIEKKPDHDGVRIVEVHNNDLLVLKAAIEIWKSWERLMIILTEDRPVVVRKPIDD